MQKTFKNIGARGFTLIELLVVIAIIGLLSTVIAAPITQARKKGRDGKKVADLHQLEGALQQYADDNAGNFPTGLSDMVPKYLSVLPPFGSATAAPKDKYMYVKYETTTNGDIRAVAFHLGVKLEASNLALGEDRDCAGWGSITAVNAYCVDSTADATRIMLATPDNFTVGGASTHANDVFVPAGITAGAQNVYNSAIDANDSTVGDFNGGFDTATTSCKAVIKGAGVGTDGACIYDITNN
jgi:prepilin-type N-terminal cleavage/methylation domain-containing protein